VSEALTADEVIAHLGLKPHPEGGWFRETFRDEVGPHGRAHSTAILFLLKAGEVSRWHRVDAAELWHWHGGAPLLLEIKDGETRREYRLGPDWHEGRPPACSRAGESLAERAQSRGLDAGRLHGGAGLRLLRL
jgi:predicted cupin superfamily sugar epimerase